MDLPRLALLKQIEFRLSQEGRGALFLARDTSNGRIYTLSRSLVHGLRSAKVGLAEATSGTMSGSRARDVFQFLHIVQDVRAAETRKKPTFNPVFMTIALFDVGRFQAGLSPLARVLVSPLFLVLMVALALFCLSLGMRNEWSIMDTFSTVFSLEAILTFGLIAPFLKIIHEMGHILAATRYGVTVRKAGLFLISFYPMPYVDCTDADFSAKRRDRVAISLAGIVVDVTIGMIAFIGWHFTRGTYLQTLLGNIFVFSTLNSVFFNANPLVKLDGYFALADAIGYRNLYTVASSRLSDLCLFLVTFGSRGQLPRTGKQGLITGFGLASVIYRINMLFNIALGLAPKYLGAGAVCVVWGALVMFYTPVKTFARRFMSEDAVQAPGDPPEGGKPAEDRMTRGRRRLLRGGAVLAVLAGLSALPFPFTTLVDVSLDDAQTYAVTMASDGFLDEVRPAGPVRKGDVLVRLSNPSLVEERDVVLLELREGALALQTARGDNEAKSQAALKQLQTLERRLKQLDQSLDNLVIRARDSGHFQPHVFGQSRLYLPAGMSIGALYPDHGMAWFLGQFPERYVSKFQEQLSGGEIRLNQSYHEVAAEDFRLQAIMAYEEESGGRTYVLGLPLDQAPAQLVGQPGQVRLQFEGRSIWSHLAFWYDNLLANYRQSQLADREKFLAEE